MSDLGDIFEKRIDAYMRHHNLLRASDSRVFYRHAGVEGLGYPRMPWIKRAFRKARNLFDWRHIRQRPVENFHHSVASPVETSITQTG